jgi:hypothetical protein
VSTVILAKNVEMVHVFLVKTLAESELVTSAKTIPIAHMAIIVARQKPTEFLPVHGVEKIKMETHLQNVTVVNMIMIAHSDKNVFRVVRMGKQLLFASMKPLIPLNQNVLQMVNFVMHIKNVVLV